MIEDLYKSMSIIHKQPQVSKENNMSQISLPHIEASFVTL